MDSYLFKNLFFLHYFIVTIFQRLSVSALRGKLFHWVDMRIGQLISGLLVHGRCEVGGGSWELGVARWEVRGGRWEVGVRR